jgi:hypothetical protein
MSELALFLSILTVGFALGYAFRAAISQHRHAQAIRRRQLV